MSGFRKRCSTNSLQFTIQNIESGRERIGSVKLSLKKLQIFLENNELPVIYLVIGDKDGYRFAQNSENPEWSDGTWFSEDITVAIQADILRRIRSYGAVAKRGGSQPKVAEVE